jgi:hypothetical protein
VLRHKTGVGALFGAWLIIANLENFLGTLLKHRDTKCI